MNTFTRSYLAITCTTLLHLSLLALPALAVVQEISDCDANVDADVNCTSNCKLVADIDCDTSAGEKITLNSGKNLDLNGYDISCTTSVDCTTPILVKANGSVIENTASTKSSIKGDFNVGVDCAGYANTKVLDLDFELSDQSAAGVKGCRVVEGNTLRCTAGLNCLTGIAVEGASNSRVGDNYLSGPWSIGIDHSMSSSDASTDHNIIVMDDYAFGYQRGIEVCGTGGSNSVTGNLFFGGTLPANPQDEFIAADCVGNVAPIDDNWCDPSQDACDDCINAFKCEAHPATPPVAFP